MTQVVGCPIERTGPGTRRGRPAARRRYRGRAATRAAETTSPDRTVRPAAGDLCRAMSRRSFTPAAHRATGQGQVAPFSLLDLRPGPPLGRVDRRGHRRWTHASLACRPALWSFRQRPQPDAIASDRCLRAWIEQGTPPGDLSAAPEPPKYPQGWSIGTPDVVFEMPEPFVVPAEGTVPIQHFRLATDLDGRPLDPGRRSAPGRSGRRPSHLRLHRRSQRRRPRTAQEQELAGRLHARRHAVGLFRRGSPRRSRPDRS